MEDMRLANLNDFMALLLVHLPTAFGPGSSLERSKPQEEEHFGWSGKSTGVGVSGPEL